MGSMAEKRNYAIVTIAISTLIGVANFWHVIFQWFQNPRDRYFTWIAHYYADYFLYVSQIAEGARGSWIWSRSLFTNEAMPDTWVYWPNVMMGKLGGLVSFSPFIIYSVGLVVAVICLFWLISLVTRRVFPGRPGHQIIAFLFAVSASNAVDIESFIRSGALTLTHQMWFSPSPALNRLGGVPHQALQTILLLGVVICSAKLMSCNNKKQTTHRITPYLFPILCFLAATVSPIQMLILCTAIMASAVILRLSGRQNIQLGIGLIGGAAGAVMVNRAFDASPLYSAAKTWEASQGISVSLWELMLSMGPVILFIPFGIAAFSRLASPIRLLLLCYGFMSLLLFSSGIPGVLKTSPTRWIHPTSFLVWYLIAADGWIILSEKLNHIIMRSKFVPGSLGEQLPRLIPALLIFIYIALTAPSVLAQVEARTTKEYAPALYSDINHVPLPVIDTLNTIQKSPRTGTVLMDPALPYDSLVPAISGKRTFTGHPIHTLYPETKERLRVRFFSGLMNEAEAAQFMRDHTIIYIVYSPNSTQKMPRYPFLTEVTANTTSSLYEVIR